MNKTTIICEWLGWTRIIPKKGHDFNPYWQDATGDSRYYPPFNDCNEDAITLLSALVERGYLPQLKYEYSLWHCRIHIPHMMAPVYVGDETTIAAAITSAVLRLIAEEK